MSNKQTVLIVDDEAINIQVLGQWLSKECKVLTATNAEQALEISVKQKPDLVLLDIVMPGTDGYEVCRRLKNNTETVNIPIIFVTGMTSTTDEARGLELGAVDYVAKPFNQAIVMARVRNQLLLKKKTDLLEQLISVDGLTDIPNRRYFDQHYSQEWRRSMRNQMPLAVFMCDIDNFKLFNDHYGHAVGDECLKKVAQALSKNIQRAGEFVARYGGEEFVAVLPNCDMKTAKIIGNKFVQEVEKLQIPHEESPNSNYVTLSIGAAVQIITANCQSSELLLAADEQLYAAKDSGRNQCLVINLDDN